MMVTIYNAYIMARARAATSVSWSGKCQWFMDNLSMELVFTEENLSTALASCIATSAWQISPLLQDRHSLIHLLLGGQYCP